MRSAAQPWQPDSSLRSAVREGEALAAAVAESAEQAYRDWCEQTGHQDPQAFFDAAHRGRRWRAAPTALLGQLVLNRSPQAASYAEALAEACRAAQTLGVPNPRTAGNAAVAVAAQLGALTAPQSRTTTQPEVIDMLRVLEESSLDLTSMDIPGGFSGIDSTEDAKMRPELVEGQPAGASKSSVHIRGRSASGEACEKKAESWRPRLSPNPRHSRNCSPNLTPLSASRRSKPKSTGKWQCFGWRRCAARRA